MRSVAIFTRERWLLAIHSPKGEQRRDKASQVPLTRVGPGRSKRTGDAKGVCSPSPPFVTSPLPLSLSPPFPRVKKRRQTSHRRAITTLDSSYSRDRPAFTYKSVQSGCYRADLERKREREGGAGFRIALMNGRCRTAATIYSMTATTTIDPETKRRVPLDCVTRRGTFTRLSFATCHR